MSDNIYPIIENPQNSSESVPWGSGINRKSISEDTDLVTAKDPADQTTDVVVAIKKGSVSEGDVKGIYVGYWGTELIDFEDQDVTWGPFKPEEASSDKFEGEEADFEQQQEIHWSSHEGEESSSDESTGSNSTLEIENPSSPGGEPDEEPKYFDKITDKSEISNNSSVFQNSGSSYSDLEATKRCKRRLGMVSKCAEPPTESKKRCVECYDDPFNLPLAEQELALFQMTLDFIKGDNQLSILQPLYDVLGGVYTRQEFAEAVFNASILDTFFWQIIKYVTVGSHNGITIGSCGELVKKIECPIQFGGLKDQYKSSIIPVYFNALGAHGEKWTFDKVLKPFIPSNQPGKICDTDFPVYTTTPDYLMYTTKSKMWEDGQCFVPDSILGIGECKTSSLMSSKKGAVWTFPNTTVSEIIKETKPASIQSMFLFSNKKQIQPKWLAEHTHLWVSIIEHIKKTTVWYLKYWENEEDEGCEEKAVTKCFDTTEVGNQVYLKPFSTPQGKQMMCEANCVLKYASRDRIEIFGFFPSVKPVSSPDATLSDMKVCSSEFKFQTMYCLYFKTEIATDLMTELSELCKKNMIKTFLSVATSSCLKVKKVGPARPL